MLCSETEKEKHETYSAGPEAQVILNQYSARLKTVHQSDNKARARKELKSMLGRRPCIRHAASDVPCGSVEHNLPVVLQNIAQAPYHAALHCCDEVA